MTQPTALRCIEAYLKELPQAQQGARLLVGIKSAVDEEPEHTEDPALAAAPKWNYQPALNESVRFFKDWRLVWIANGVDGHSKRRRGRRSPRTVFKGGW